MAISWIISDGMAISDIVKNNAKNWVPKAFIEELTTVYHEQRLHMHIYPVYSSTAILQKSMAEDWFSCL